MPKEKSFPGFSAWYGPLPRGSRPAGSQSPRASADRPSQSESTIAPHPHHGDQAAVASISSSRISSCQCNWAVTGCCFFRRSVRLVVVCRLHRWRFGSLGVSQSPGRFLLAATAGSRLRRGARLSVVHARPAIRPGHPIHTARVQRAHTHAHRPTRGHHRRQRTRRGGSAHPAVQRTTDRRRRRCERSIGPFVCR